jgi:hypothetical protein
MTKNVWILMTKYFQNCNMYAPFTQVTILLQTSVHLLAAERITQLGHSEISFMNWDFPLQLR